MGRRALVGTVATLGVVALVGLFAALSLLLSSPLPAYAQGANSAPAFTEGAAADREVAENSPAFHPFGDPVTATDNDANERLVYTLENARTSPFTIVRATGQLQVGLPLDHENTNEYTVKVKVTDRDGATDTITVTITVENVEEDGKVTLSWTRPQVGTAITATLTDPDVVSGTETWLWARSNHLNGQYTNISGATAATYTPKDDTGNSDVGNYLRATASYTDEKSPGKTAHAVTVVAVRAVPENNAPAFGEDYSGSYDCGDNNNETFCMNVRKNDPVGKSIYYPVRATDDPGDEIRYSLDGSDSGHFAIVPVRGELSAKTLPAEPD